jgi:polar amino acid transport system permease protein
MIPMLLSGLSTTLVVFFGGCVVALAGSLLGGLGRLSRDPIVRTFSTIYVEVFRGTSALVQLYWFYFALPLTLGIELDAVVVGIIVLGLNVGAYGAEAFRGAVEAVPRGQIYAATALNLTDRQTMRYVVLPQAILSMLPAFGNLLIELLKSTALVSMITVTDLTRAGLFIRDDTLRTVQVFSLLLLIYLCLSLLITAAVRTLEQRLKARLGVGGKS